MVSVTKQGYPLLLCHRQLNPQRKHWLRFILVQPCLSFIFQMIFSYASFSFSWIWTLQILRSCRHLQLRPLQLRQVCPSLSLLNHSCPIYFVGLGPPHHYFWKESVQTQLHLLIEYRNKIRKKLQTHQIPELLTGEGQLSSPGIAWCSWCRQADPCHL